MSFEKCKQFKNIKITLHLKNQGLYSQLLIFFLTYELAQ
jgi:hypothetical protein